MMNSRTIFGAALGVSVSIGVVLVSCGGEDDDSPEGSGGVSAASGGNNAMGGGSQTQVGGSTSGGGSALPDCGRAPNDSICEGVSFEMPPKVTLRADPGPWDTTMQGKMTPGTYVLTDLAKHGDPPTCTQTASVIYVFGTDGRFTHGWDEGTHSIRYSGTYEDGPVDGSVRTTVDCPAGATPGSGGIAFRMTETGFTVTNNDGTVYTLTRR